MASNSLHTTLQKLNENSISPSLINEAVSIFHRIALNILNKKIALNQIYLHPEFISVNDLAMSAITPLFIKDKNGDFAICNSLKNWDRKIDDEESAKYFLFKIISSRIEQELSNALKEADPFFGKILRSINNCIETGKCNKTTWFGMVYLIPTTETRITQKPLDSESLEQYPTEFFQGNSAKIILNLFEHIRNETDFFLAIPLNALIKKIKHVNGFLFELINTENKKVYYEEYLDISKIVNASVLVVNQRIDDFYVSKGKINSEDGEVFKKVVKDFTVDMQDGGLSRGLYEYLLPYKPGITKELFYQKYQQQVDYLLRLLKKEIATRLETNYK